MIEFHKGSEISLESGDTIEVSGDYLKKGGQGYIYRASFNNNPVILKWYHSKSVLNNTDFRSNLHELTKLKQISGFVMPRMLTTIRNGEFGFIMEQIPDDSNIVQLSSVIYDPDIEFKATKARIEAPVLIAESFAALHEKNLVFRDINDTNIFVNIRSPKIYICDCDNISEPNTNSSVKGKPGFMAPELESSGSRKNPDELSDRYSLAVVLYMLILRDHPFEGKAMEGLDRDSMNDSIKCKRVFTMSPSDQSNRPDIHVIDNWNGLPEYIRELFIRTFTTGIEQREERASAKEWSKSLRKWITEYDTYKANKSTKIELKCKRRYQPIFFIIDSSKSMLTNDRMNMVNKALNDYVHEARQFEDTEIAINILQFSKNAKWYFDKLKSINHIDGDNVINLCIGEQYTHLSEALGKLDVELNKNNVFDDSKHPNRPLILLLSDGYVKRSEYIIELKSLERNHWFKKSYKYAIGIETDGEGLEMLQDFTGDYRLVHSTSNGDDVNLGDLIKNVTMTITQSITQTNEPFIEDIEGLM